MQLRHLLATTTLFCAGLVPILPVRADTVLYDSAGFLQGSQSFVDSFNITTPGTLTVSLADVPWLDAIENLHFFLTSSSGVIGSSMSGGTESVVVGTGTLYAHWFGTASGTYDLGVFALKITFQPGVATPVPLPGTLILLLSGLALTFASGWRRAAAFVVALVWVSCVPAEASYAPPDGARAASA